MKTKFLLLALLLCACLTASAQTPDSVFYRHSLGVIASPVLDNLLTANRELPVGLIYKRQHKMNGAFRATLLAAHDSYKFTSIYRQPDENDKTRNSYLQITGGYEWQLPLDGRWRFYYGAEVGAFLDRKVQDDLSYRQTDNGDAIYTYYAVDEKRGVLLRPFAGIILQLSNRIYLATETAILARHQRRDSDTKEKMNIISSNEVLLDVHSNGIWRENILTYQPLSNVSILLRF
jgi:hypothetical protein